MNKILITCGGGFQGQTLIDLIKKSESNNQIILLDTNNDNINIYNGIDYFYIPPNIADKNLYIEFIENLVKRHYVNFIIPSTSLDIEILSEIKDLFFDKYNTRVIVPDKEIIEALLNKKLSNDFFNYHQLSVLPNYHIKEVIEENFKPIIAKHIYGFGSKNIIYIRNFYELKKLVNDTDFNSSDYIFNPLIENFEEYSIDFSVSYEGKVSEFVLRKRAHVSLGFAIISIVNDEEKYNILRHDLEKIKKIFSSKKYSGIYNIQVLFDNNNKYYFNDINPRIGTSASFSLLSGYNIIDNVLSKEYNQQKQTQSKKAVKFISQYEVPNERFIIKNAIIDLDGTLVDTLNFTIKRFLLLYDILIKDYSFSIEKDDYQYEVFNIIASQKLSTAIDVLSNKYDIPKDILMNLYRNCLPEVPIYQDAFNLLNYFNEKNIKVYLLSKTTNYTTQEHKIKPIQRYLKKKYLLQNKFDKVNNFNAYRLIIDENHLNEKETITIGDNLIDDIFPALQTNILLKFYLVRQFNYIPSISVDGFESYSNRIKIINNLYEIKNYIL
ncbi:MAG: ATP-grasp domain-containing protein [Bacteroidota bacterium]